MDSSGKLAFLWMMTSGQTTCIGVCRASAKRFSFETGLPEEALERTVKILSRNLYWTDGTIFIRNFIRYQYGSGAKLTRNTIFPVLVRTVSEIRENPLKQAIFEEYPEIKDAHDKGIPSPPSGVRTREREGKGEGSEVGCGEEEIAEQIDSIYRAYPLKVGKPDALKAIRKSVIKCSADLVLERTQAYAEMMRRENPGMDYVPHPATFFNQERFNDDPSTWLKHHQKNGHVPVGFTIEGLRKRIQSHPANRDSTSYDGNPSADLVAELSQLKKQLEAFSNGHT